MNKYFMDSLSVTSSLNTLYLTATKKYSGHMSDIMYSYITLALLKLQRKTSQFFKAQRVVIIYYFFTIIQIFYFCTIKITRHKI